MGRGVALLVGLLATTACTPATKAPGGAERGGGNLLLFGGGDRPDDVMRLFVQLAGGERARIVVLPLASEDSRATGEELRRTLEAQGALDVGVIHIDDRRDAERPDYVAQVRAASGVFFGGGDQRRITARLVDTPLLEALRHVEDGGGVVGGTSAGTVCQSPLMLTGDGNDQSLAPDSMVVERGLGLFEGVVLDSHFVVRRRFTRLQSVVLQHPQLLGIGVDEATAVWVQPEGTLQVLGRGSVVVYDASAAHLELRDGALAASGLKTYVLAPGQRYDLHSRAVLR